MSSNFPPRKSALKQWLDCREEEMQDEAARLAKLERELAQQQLDWHEQRQHYEAEIKSLNEQLRSRDAA